jgi:hypothetical protein
MLNYLYGVMISEIAIALHAYGLDPSLGVLHADKDDRASLAYDLIEPARSIVDYWFLHWLKNATFSKRDFLEDVSGGVRIMRPLSSHLAMSAGLWRGIADKLAQWFVACLQNDKIRLPMLHLPVINLSARAGGHAARWQLGNHLQSVMPRLCRECGKTLMVGSRRRRFCSDDCRLSFHGLRYDPLIANRRQRVEANILERINK